MSRDTLPHAFLSTRQRSTIHFLWVCGLLTTLAQPMLAHGTDLPHMCNADNTQVSGSTSGSQTEPADCYEFGAAMGELGWNWRKKMPSQVRWIMRKDALELCGQTQTEFGRKVVSPVPGGCVFLAPTACTIVTPGPISPASIGNAVRDCVP